MDVSVAEVSFEVRVGVGVDTKSKLLMPYFPSERQLDHHRCNSTRFTCVTVIILWTVLSGLYSLDECDWHTLVSPPCSVESSAPAMDVRRCSNTSL